MSGADDLFSTEGPPPVRDRLERAARLTGLAAALSVAGPCLFTGVPGAILAVIAWQTADDELARVEAGALPPERRGRAAQVRGAAFATMMASGLFLLLELGLLVFGVYEALIVLVAAALGYDVGVPAP